MDPSGLKILSDSFEGLRVSLDTQELRASCNFPPQPEKASSIREDNYLAKSETPLGVAHLDKQLPQ